MLTKFSVKKPFNIVVALIMVLILDLSILSVGVGVGTEILQTLAIDAIGGLLYAILLTLFVVPIMYDILHGDEYKVVIIEEDE